jgi:hypothetical protein
MSKKKTDSSPTAEQLVRAATDGLVGVARQGEVGEFAAPRFEDGVWVVEAQSTQPGYPGWVWTVTITPGAEGQLTVTEVNLLPGEQALLSPEWVPWSKRLDDYRRQEAEREALDIHDGDDEHDDHDDDDDEHDDHDLDDVLDGIDIDQLDLDLDPEPLEVPDEPNDVFDHVELDEADDEELAR